MTQGAIRAALAAENVERCIPPLPDAEVAQIATSIGRYPPATGGSNRETESDPAPVLCCMADIAPEPLRWLWPGRLPLGKAALVFGDPGFGKTLVTQDMAARVSRGIPWPDLPGERTAPGGVVILSAEDDAADTIRPRLDAAGADPRRIFLLRGVKTGDGANAAHFNLACDLPALEAAIRQTPDARLVIIDPISAYLGGTDSHRNSEVRGLLAPLADLAARYDVALVAVSHLNKGAGGRALYRATGSLAFVAAARAAWLVIADPEDANRRLFLPAKMNLAEEPSGLAYRIVPVTLDGIGPVARVEWERDAVNIRADEALAAAASGENRTAQDAAGAWLRDALAGGAVPQKDLVERAERDGIKAHTLYRAKTALGVIAGKQGLSGGWTWRLP